MTYKLFLTIASIATFLFALGFILMPVQLMSIYNIDLNAGGTLVGRLFGAALFGFGLWYWFNRDIQDKTAKQALLTANLFGDGLGFIFILVGQLGGVPGINALGWSSVLVYLLLVAGFAYFRFFAR